jgi:hypothetical protein
MSNPILGKKAWLTSDIFLMKLFLGLESWQSQILLASLKEGV